MGRICLRVSANYWEEEKDLGYKFEGYSADYRFSNTQRWKSTPRSRESLLGIVQAVVSDTHSQRIHSPDLKVYLVEGECPEKRHRKENTRLLTKKPKETIVPILQKSFEDFYSSRDAFHLFLREKDYVGAFEVVLKQPRGLRSEILMGTDPRDFYINLRKVNKVKAKRFIGEFFPDSSDAFELKFYRTMCPDL